MSEKELYPEFAFCVKLIKEPGKLRTIGAILLLFVALPISLLRYMAGTAEGK